jgi:hypothetical protein
VTPEEFLQNLLEFDPELVVEVIREMTAQKKRPPMTDLDMLQAYCKDRANVCGPLLSPLGS